MKRMGHKSVMGIVKGDKEKMALNLEEGIHTGKEAHRKQFITDNNMGRETGSLSVK